MTRLLFAMMVAAANPVHAQPCEVSGVVNLDDLEVRPPGEAPLHMVVRQAPVIAQPASGSRHHVEVRSSLAFVATSESPPYALRRRVETGHGMVTLAQSIKIDRVRSDGSGVRARAHLNPWVRVRNLAIPCDGLALGSVAASESTPPVLPQTDGTIWRARGRTLTFHGAPGSRSVIHVQLRRGAPFRLDRVERSRGWMKLMWRAGQSSILGWVRAAEVRRAVGGRGWGTTGGSGTMGCRRGRRSGPGVYQGPAQLRPGTLVRSSPRGAVWAAVRPAEGFEVVQVHGATWTQIIVAPGIHEDGACALRSAWIRSEDVTLPQSNVEPNE